MDGGFGALSVTSCAPPYSGIPVVLSGTPVGHYVLRLAISREEGGATPIGVGPAWGRLDGCPATKATAAILLLLPPHMLLLNSSLCQNGN